MPMENFRSQPFSKPLAGEEFRPRPLPVEDFRPRPFPVEDFRPRPLPVGDFRSQQLPNPLPGEGFRSQPLPNALRGDGFRSQPLPHALPGEGFRSQPFPNSLPGEGFRSQPFPNSFPGEGFRSQPLPNPLPMEDFRSQPYPKPLPVGDFRSRPLPVEDFRSRPLPVEDFRSRPLPVEDFRSRPLPVEDFRSRPLPMEDLRTRPLPMEDFRSRPLSMENFQSRPYHMEAPRREEFQSLLLPRHDLHALPLIREDLHVQSLPREGSHSQPILRQDFRAQPLFRDNSRASSALTEEFRPHSMLREDTRSQVLPRGHSHFQADGFASHSMLQDGLRFPHVPREDMRFRGDDVQSREDLHPNPLSRPELQLQPLPRDFPLLQQHSVIRDPLSSAQSLLSGSSSMLQRNSLQGNSPGLSHANFPSNADHLRPGYPTSFSLINQPTQHSAIGEHPASSHHNPFAVNLNSDSQTGFNSKTTMREPDFNVNPFAPRTTDFTHNVSLRSESALEPYSLQHLSSSGHGNLASRPLSMPPLSPLNISRPGIQPVPRSIGSNPSAISGEWQTYLNSHAGGSSIAGISSLHWSGKDISASGDQYDPLYDSIEPVAAGGTDSLKKLFDSTKEEEKDARGGIESGRAPLLENVSPHNEGGKIRIGGLCQPQDVEENNKHKDGATSAFKQIEADEGAEEPMDAEVGAVENGSPAVEEGKNWSPGHPLEVATAGAGEIEIDQVQATGKSKKTKESRQMKLFRSALAEFVKEVLKPSWREGHMSKEAFKTIVKKAVDKVAGALQSHQIPKTQGRIDQYVASSQRKLTKLVQGYIDKYVKT